MTQIVKALGKVNANQKPVRAAAIKAMVDSFQNKSASEESIAWEKKSIDNKKYYG